MNLIFGAADEIERLGAALVEVNAALFEPNTLDAEYNLEGALYDLQTFSRNDEAPDAVCLSTMRRVIAQIAKAKAALSGTNLTQLKQNADKSSS